MIYSFLPQQFLYFLPLPHGHGSLRPTFLPSFVTCKDALDRTMLNIVACQDSQLDGAAYTVVSKTSA